MVECGAKCMLAVAVGRQGTSLWDFLPVKVSEPVWMFPRLLLGRKGDILAGLLIVKVNELKRMFPS